MSATFTLATYATFAVLLLGFLSGAKFLAHDTVVRADAQEVRTALEVYNLEHGEYPHKISELIPQYLSEPTNDDLSKLKYAQVAGGAAYSLKLSE